MTFFENITEQNGWLVLTNILLYFCLFVTFYPAFKTNQVLSHKRHIAGVICMFLFCLFSFWGPDWFHYAQYFENIKFGDLNHVNMEDIHIFLMDICPSYILWRAITWGIALWLVLRTCKNLDINIDIVLFLFCSIFIIWFSYARVSLAMAMIFYGFSCMQVSKRKLSYILGLILISLSFFVHKSAPFAIVIVIITELCCHYPKKAIILFLLALPILVFLAKSLFLSSFDSLLLDDSNALNEYAAAGSFYLDEEVDLTGWGSKIGNILCQLSYYLIALECIIVILQDNDDISQIGKSFLLLTVFMILSATIFRFDLGASTRVLYIRFLRSSQIPAAISLAYIYTYGGLNKLTRFTYRIAIVSAIYSLLYSWYIAAI